MFDCKSQILSTISNNNCCSHAFINAVISFASQISKNRNNILIEQYLMYVVQILIVLFE